MIFSIYEREIKPVNPKGNQSWIFIGRTDAEAETPILWPPDAENWLIRKDSDAGKGWRQEEKGMTDEMIGWHHQLDGHESEQAPGVGDGEGSLVCCRFHGVTKSQTRLNNWTELIHERQYILIFNYYISLYYMWSYMHLLLYKYNTSSLLNNLYIFKLYII